jgi:hypothetical protein
LRDLAATRCADHDLESPATVSIDGRRRQSTPWRPGNPESHLGRALSGPVHPIDPRHEHHLAAIRISIGHAPVRLPVRVLGGRRLAGGGHPGHQTLLGGRVGHLEHQHVDAIHATGGPGRPDDPAGWRCRGGRRSCRPPRSFPGSAPAPAVRQGRGRTGRCGRSGRLFGRRGPPRLADGRASGWLPAVGWTSPPV